MKIERVIINNYRNLRSVDVHINRTVALIGENNSGKSNFLRAITLPFISDEYTSTSKNLAWTDINNDAKQKYYQYIIDNQKRIKDETISPDELIKNMPYISVEVHLVTNLVEN